jgi:pimeloyl-ACP methyl ester carboxylesterase
MHDCWWLADLLGATLGVRRLGRPSPLCYTPPAMTPETPSDPPLQTVNIAGRGSFAYTVEGEGPVLVVIHGLPGSVRDFRWLGAALGDRLRIVRLDLPGFGGTPARSRSGWSIPARAADAVAALGAIGEIVGFERFAVAGHSMGGGVATGIAALAPERVTSLVLLASIGLRPHERFRDQSGTRSISRMLRMPLLGRLLHPRLQLGFVQAGFPSSTPVQDLVHTMHCLAQVSFADLNAYAAAIKGPVLVSWAQDDPLVEPPIAEELVAHYGAETAPFDEGGHNIQKTQAVELAERLTSFVAAHSG